MNSCWLEEAGLHGHPCHGCFLCGCVRNRRGQVHIWLMAGYRSILCFKPLERLHLAGTHSLGSAEFIASKVVALANLLLDGALNVAKGELRIAPARPTQCVLKEAQLVAVRGKPGFIKSRAIAMSIMRCAA